MNAVITAHAAPRVLDQKKKKTKLDIVNSFFFFYVIVGKIFGLNNFNSIEVCMGSVIVIYFFFFFSRISATGACGGIRNHQPSLHLQCTDHPWHGRKKDGLTKRIGDESYNFDPEKQMLHAAVVSTARCRLASLNFNNHSPYTTPTVTRPTTFAAVRHAQSKTFHFTIIIVRVPPSINIHI